MRGTGAQEEWRVRVGDCRIIYRVDDEAQEGIILAVGHRGSVYGCDFFDHVRRLGGLRFDRWES